jgi:outer membrane protein
MKKATLIFNILVILAIATLTWLHFRADKIAYVDTNVLMQKYEGMKKARAEYEVKAKQWQANSDTLMKEFEAELKNYEKERSRMTKKEQELKEELLGNKQQQISKYRQATQMKAKEEEQKLTQTVVNTVNDYINEYGKKHGYKYILGANGSGSLLYAEKKNEITDIILEGLNKEYKKK